jgi:hypothetical protein
MWEGGEKLQKESEWEGKLQRLGGEGGKESTAFAVPGVLLEAIAFVLPVMPGEPQPSFFPSPFRWREIQRHRRLEHLGKRLRSLRPAQLVLLGWAGEREKPNTGITKSRGEGVHPIFLLEKLSPFRSLPSAHPCHGQPPDSFFFFLKKKKEKSGPKASPLHCGERGLRHLRLPLGPVVAHP